MYPDSHGTKEVIIIIIIIIIVMFVMSHLSQDRAWCRRNRAEMFSVSAALSPEWMMLVLENFLHRTGRFLLELILVRDISTIIFIHLGNFDVYWFSH